MHYVFTKRMAYVIYQAAVLYFNHCFYSTVPTWYFGALRQIKKGCPLQRQLAKFYETPYSSLYLWHMLSYKNNGKKNWK